MMNEQQHAGPIDSLIADFRLAMRRLKERPLDSIEAVNRELHDNVFPSMIALAEQIAEVDEVIQEVVEHQESYISVELAGQISETIAVGFALIKTMRDLEISDQLAKKRLDDLAAAFEKSAELTMMGVADAAPDEDEDDPDEDDPDEDESEIEAEPSPPAPIVS